MSEPKLISPLLDGYIIGQSISYHDGVRCCPAIREATDEKFIVKIISVPASQVQLEALLLTGAYENNEAALEYFQSLAQDILKEKDTLSSLSRLDGFTPYLDAQIVPMEDGVGFEVYLLSPYKRSMEKVLAANTLTHLQAVNLGLDLCAALAAARRAGQLYVDLKPSNIFDLQDQGYRIGDLGFVPLSSLRYASLADKYRSAYSPAEVLEDMALLNETVDTYALGLVLYQAYNGGQLPEDLQHPVPPMYADYEMSEIILTACHPELQKRWQSPAQMGQALVQYMQRNSVNDEPIIPPPPPVEEPEEEVPQSEEEFLPETEPQSEELAFLEELVNDETAPTEENTEDLPEDILTEETSQMLAQADELIEHELPEPVVAPDPIEVPMPVPEGQEEEAPVQEPIPEDPQGEVIPEAQEEVREAAPRKKRTGLVIAAILVLALLIGGAVSGVYYYQNIYMQYVDDMIVSGTVDTVTVQVISRIEEGLLTVVCTDSYGNTYRQSVSQGLAVFKDLQPQTRYTFRLEISGFHKLNIEEPTLSFTTATQTNILSFTAGIGPKDGSVLLNFTVGGKDIDNWTVTYGAEGVPEKSLSFTGHSVTIEDLVIGADYTFTLSSKESPYIIGNTQVSFLSSAILFAEDLTITACGGGNLTVTWNAPEGHAGTTWLVRCYDEKGYNQTITTTDTSYTFTGLDHTSKATVEIFAEGMNQSTAVSIDANPITIGAFHYDATDVNALRLTWDFIGPAPAGGWILRYTTDGYTQQEILTQNNSAELYALPKAVYKVTVESADGNVIFGGSSSYQMPESDGFSGYWLTYQDLEFKMCLRPDRDKWNWTHVADGDYTTSFKPGQAAGFVVNVHANYDVSFDNIQIKYVLRDSEGNLVRVDTQDIQWSYIWYGLYGEFDIPYMPEASGDYFLSVYFNGKFVAQQPFQILQ